MEIKTEIPPTALPRRVFLCWSCELTEGLGRGFCSRRHLLSGETLAEVCPAPRPEFSALTFLSLTALFMGHNDSFRRPSRHRRPMTGLAVTFRKLDHFLHKSSLVGA